MFNDLKRVRGKWQKLLCLLVIVLVAWTIPNVQASNDTDERSSGVARNGTGILTIVKYNDLDGNGSQDAGENGLQNWEFKVYDSLNTLVDTVTTDANGVATVSSLEVATYKVCETPQAGWKNTTSACQTVTLTQVSQAPQTVYVLNNFSSPVGPEWTNGVTEIAPNSNSVLGRYTEDSAVTLSLTGLPAHTQIEVNFKLYILNTWDGDSNTNNLGPDYWRLSADNVSIFDETFSNALSTQSYPTDNSTPRTGAVSVDSLGSSNSDPNGWFTDTLYDLNLPTFDHTASTLNLTFSSSGLQAILNDETWAIDDVEVIAINQGVMGEVKFGNQACPDGSVVNTTTNESFCTIQDGIQDSDTLSGHTLFVHPGTYPEVGQIVIDKNLTIEGANKATVIIKPTGDTGNGGSGDARGWFLVNAGVKFNLKKVTLDGDGFKLNQGLRINGSGSINNVILKNIGFNPSGPDYAGIAIAARGDGAVSVKNSTFTNIGRVGAHFFGAGVTGSVFENNTYTGKGIGNWLDYGVELGGGAKVTVKDNTISKNQGVATVDGSGSAAMLISTYFDPGTEGYVENNEFYDSSVGIYIGYDENDTSVANIKKNKIYNTDYGIVTTGTADVTLTDNQIYNNQESGVDIYKGTKLTASGNWVYGNKNGFVLTETGVVALTGNVIYEQTNSGIQVVDATSAAALTANNNDLCRNVVYGVENLATATFINAQSNWWGKADGPGPIGPGTGDKVTAGVNFSNFLTAPAVTNSPCAPTDGTFKVFKYNDLDQSGMYNTGDAPLPGWNFTVYTDNTKTTTVTSGTTDANGEISFTLPFGDYYVCETLKTSWVNSDPGGSEPCEPVTVAFGTTPDLQFGNYKVFVETEVIVRPSNMQGWTIENQRPSAFGGITTDQPRSGNGSLEFEILTPYTPVSPSPDKVDWQKAWNPDPNLTLSTLDTLRYEYYRVGTSTVINHLHPVLRILFYDTKGTQTTSDDVTGTLIWEEVYQAGFSSVPVDTWDANNILTQRFWMFRPGSGVVEKYDFTLQDWMTHTNPSYPKLSPDTLIYGVNTGIGSGWSNGTTTFNGFVDNVAVGFNGVATRYNFEPDLKGDLVVTKFNDLNGDGDQDTGEDVLEGWSFEVFDNSNASQGVMTTDVNGQAKLENLAPGQYSVVETPTQEQAQCWVVTTQGGATQAATIVGDQETSLTFGNQYVCLPPDAVNDAAQTTYQANINIPVLTNDTDPNNDVLTVISVTQGTKGTVSINGDGTVKYTHTGSLGAGQVTTDTFTYTISDGKGGTDTATVTVEIVRLHLTSFCPPGEFRVRNPGSFAINYTWDVYNTIPATPGTAQPGDNFFNTGLGSGTVRLFVGNVQHDVKATLRNCLEVKKVVDWNGSTPDPNLTFEICIFGPSYPAPTKTANNCKQLGDGQTANWSNLIVGSYEVVETPVSGWDVSGETTLDIQDGQTSTYQATITNTYIPPTGDLVVTKFNDLNGDGDQDTGEDVLEGWSFEVFDSSNTSQGVMTTDVNGQAKFESLPTGIYTVVEKPTSEQESCWQVTTPAAQPSLTQTAQVAGGQQTAVTYGNQNVCEIPVAVTINKFNDANSSKLQDGNEQSLGGWSFTVKQNNQVVTSGTTDANGKIELNLLPGEYVITETLLGNCWVSTTGVTQTVTIEPQTPATFSFGNRYICQRPPAQCANITIHNQIIGTNGYNVINGTEGNDLILARGGTDIVHGMGGDDCILGENGSDELYGDAGNDIILGGNGKDDIYGGDGDDLGYGDNDDDFLSGGNGNDRLFGNNGNDCVVGGDGDDFIDGGAGNDAPLIGNGGNDTIYGGTGHDELYGDGLIGKAGGHDGEFGPNVGAPGNDTLYGGQGHDELYGGPLNDRLYGEQGSDDLFGNEGDDIMTGGTQYDDFVGGLNSDSVTDFNPGQDTCSEVETGC